MWTVLLSLLFNSLVVQAYPVFTFKSTLSLKEKGPTFANLAKEIPLPENFILCASIKQARFDDVGFYTIDGQDSQEWLAMEFQTFSKETKLIIRRGKSFHKIGELPNAWLDYWYHICMRLDLKDSKIAVAVNGEWLGNTAVNVTNKPNKLKMKIGVGYQNQQFQGSVANIQLYTEGNVTVMSRSPCQSWQATLLIWDPNDWKVTGSDWVLTEEFEDIFCNISDNYNLAIPTWSTIQESLDICKHKLNNSVIPFEENHVSFLKYIEWHANTTGGTCVDIWTPFSDKQSEGVFINNNNNNNNNNVTDIDFWSESEPNGGRDENFVVISVARRALVDVPEKTRGCSCCSIQSSMLLKLDGVCKDSMIGKIYS